MSSVRKVGEVYYYPRTPLIAVLDRASTIAGLNSDADRADHTDRAEKIVRALLAAGVVPTSKQNQDPFLGAMRSKDMKRTVSDGSSCSSHSVQASMPLKDTLTGTLADLTSLSRAEGTAQRIGEPSPEPGAAGGGSR